MRKDTLSSIFVQTVLRATRRIQLQQNYSSLNMVENTLRHGSLKYSFSKSTIEHYACTRHKRIYRKKGFQQVFISEWRTRGLLDIYLEEMERLL